MNFKYIAALVAAALLVGSRLIRKIYHQKAMKALSEHRWDLPLIRAVSFEIPGVPVIEPTPGKSFWTAFTWKPVLTHLDLKEKGKGDIYELCYGLQRSRRLYSLRLKGSKTQVLCVPSVADLLNLVTLLIAVLLIISFTRAPWFFGVAMLALFLFEFYSRGRVSEASARADLEKFFKQA